MMKKIIFAAICKESRFGRHPSAETAYNIKKI